MAPAVGLSLITDPAWIEAAKPLFAEHLVDALEWDLDATWAFAREGQGIPSWTERLLDLYAADGRLYGHCVWFSLLTARAQQRQMAWLERVARECGRRSYRHVSEHLGFMSAGPYTMNTMLPLPHVDAAVAVGRDRLARIAEATGTAVGLENMAVALAPADAMTQASLLEDILAPLDGFVLLDVHNVFAQAVNLGIDPRMLLDTLPCERVREIHVAGGQWLDVGGERHRLDGHDDQVPREAFDLLAAALARCGNVEVIIFERRSGTLRRPEDLEGFRSDYRRLVDVVRSTPPPARAAIPRSASPFSRSEVRLDALRDAAALADYQEALVDVLARTGSPGTLQAALLAHPAALPLRDYVASFDARCVAATAQLSRRWARMDLDASHPIGMAADIWPAKA